jgi:anaerobic selenocysteine-containing dehydrogenase
MLTYNHPAIPPLGECKSNWEVVNLLAQAMGFEEPWLHQTADEAIDEILRATALSNPAFHGITLERLKENGAVPLAVTEAVPFADGRFPTPTGKVELYSQSLADEGLDPLPGGFKGGEDDGGNASGGGRFASSAALRLVTAASHHFVSSSLANQTGLLRGEGPVRVEIHPRDAAERGIGDGDQVILENGRGWFAAQAAVTDAVRPGVVASPKGRWAKLSGGRNANWTTSDALADMAGQSTFHSNCVWVRRGSP